MNLYKSRSLPIFCLCTLMLCTQYSIGDQVRISTFEHETARMDVSTQVLANIYQRLGHEMKLIRFPGKRSLVEANQGNVSGELIRVKTAAQLLPNLVLIPTPVGRLKAMVLTLKGQPKIVGMGGLLGKRVGILRGIEFTNRITQNLSRQVLNSIDSLFQTLLNGRVEVIIFPKLDAIEYLESHQLTGKVMISEAPIIEVSLYHYIHKSHPTLIKEMTALLKEIESSGELEAIINAAEQAHY